MNRNSDQTQALVRFHYSISAGEYGSVDDSTDSL